MLIIVSFRLEIVEKKSTLKLLALRRLKVSSSYLEFWMGQVPFYFEIIFMIKTSDYLSNNRGDWMTFSGSILDIPKSVANSSP